MKPKAVAWDETNHEFILITTDENLKAICAAEWLVVRWNEEMRRYEELSWDGKWYKIGPTPTS